MGLAVEKDILEILLGKDSFLDYLVEKLLFPLQIKKLRLTLNNFYQTHNLSFMER